MFSDLVSEKVRTNRYLSMPGLYWLQTCAVHGLITLHGQQRDVTPKTWIALEPKLQTPQNQATDFLIPYLNEGDT